MSVTAVKTYLEVFGFADRVMEFSVSSATVELAAQALGCAPRQIAKSLTFDVKGESVMVVAAGDAKVDNAKFKAAFHQKAAMLPRDAVEARIGHAVGGVCPFAVKPEVQVYLDRSLCRLETVYPAAGSSNSAVRLTVEELERAAAPRAWVDVCKTEA